ncbi:hypothetical protein EPI10_015978 [Gossypium australe]|uniref:Uncharacterized protein n=1 Tax=Gossypium australe TaxID=47621 RepID=A0A5B6VMB2_9ROSI|nr:hypothetical protein EPI10_015978 [Gossypium australe]
MAMNSFMWSKERFTYNLKPTLTKAKQKGGNPYSYTYNPGWKDHPNLRWRGNQGSGNILQNFPNLLYQPPHV